MALEWGYSAMQIADQEKRDTDNRDFYCPDVW